jgi:predicted lipoprotein with Yx(FWY)xxD motif
MKTWFSFLALAAAALVAASPAAAAPKGSAAQTAKLALSRSSLGRILVDGHGRTLYLFEKDRGGRSACAGTCATYWPPFLTHGKVTPGRGVKGSLLGRTRRTDGATQVTYAGHPLYRFVDDAAPGQTKGQNVDEFGAEWYVVSPTGKKLEK